MNKIIKVTADEDRVLTLHKCGIEDVERLIKDIKEYSGLHLSLVETPRESGILELCLIASSEPEPLHYMAFNTNSLPKVVSYLIGVKEGARVMYYKMRVNPSFEPDQVLKRDK